MKYTILFWSNDRAVGVGKAANQMGVDIQDVEQAFALWKENEYKKSTHRVGEHSWLQVRGYPQSPYIGKITHFMHPTDLKKANPSNPLISFTFTLEMII